MTGVPRADEALQRTLGHGYGLVAEQAPARQDTDRVHAYDFTVGNFDVRFALG